jgi:signal transduction histidine kinase
MRLHLPRVTVVQLTGRTPDHALVVLGRGPRAAVFTGRITSRHRQRVEHLLGSGEHLLRLIDDVLDLPRIEHIRIRASVSAPDRAPPRDNRVNGFCILPNMPGTAMNARDLL